MYQQRQIITSSTHAASLQWPVWTFPFNWEQFAFDHTRERNVNYSRFSFQVDTQIRLGKRTSRVESVEAAAKDDSYYKKETHLNFSFTATCWYGQMMSSYSYILSRSTISLVVLYLIEFYGVSFCPASHHQHIIILARRTSSTWWKMWTTFPQIWNAGFM